MARRPKPVKRFRPNESTPEILEADDPRIVPDWSKACENCGHRPIVPLTGLCGPCTFGEADTAGGNW